MRRVWRKAGRKAGRGWCAGSPEADVVEAASACESEEDFRTRIARRHPR